MYPFFPLCCVTARAFCWATCLRSPSRRQCWSVSIQLAMNSCPGRRSKQRRLFPSKAGVTPLGPNLRKPGDVLCGAALQLRDLKVCFVAGTLGQGGAERQLYFIARALCEARAQVRILSLTKGEFWQKKLEN